MGLSDIEKKAVIGECKFKNETVGRQEYQTLHDRARLVNPYHVEKYLLFSLSGFSDWLTIRPIISRFGRISNMLDAFYNKTSNLLLIVAFTTLIALCL